MEWIVPAEYAGERADKALARLAGVSRAAARAALESGTVELDGQAVAPRHVVAQGSEFSGEASPPDTTLEPEPIGFDVAFEDDDLAVIDKPTGLVTHPGAGNRSGTLAAGVLYRWPRVRGVGAEDRWGIVHRLDRDTSGLLVVALSHEAFAGLSEAIRLRTVTREYLCLVAGRPETAEGTIDAPIGRDRRRPTRMRVTPDGRPSITHYAVEWSGATSSLLRVRLETGRTHQIRVHLGSIGLPVAGDPVYGRPGLADRLFLHSARLRFTHPVTGTQVDVESPLPSDLETALAAEGGEGRLDATGNVD